MANLWIHSIACPQNWLAWKRRNSSSEWISTLLGRSLSMSGLQLWCDSKLLQWFSNPRRIAVTQFSFIQVKTRQDARLWVLVGVGAGGLTQNFGISCYRYSTTDWSSPFHRCWGRLPSRETPTREGNGGRNLALQRKPICQTFLHHFQVGFAFSFAEELVIFQLMAGLCIDMFWKIIFVFLYTSLR